MGVKRIDPNDHVRLVYLMAGAYKRERAVFEELVQEGTLGLMRAIEKFDPKRGVKFSTYAVWWIRAAMSGYLETADGHGLMGRGSARKKRKAGTLPSVFSLDAKIASENGHVDTWHDLTPDDKPSSFEVIERKERLAKIRRAMHRLRMTTQERAIVRMRFEDDMTLEEIGQVYGVCRERIRQILAPVLTALRPRLESYQ